MNKNLIYLGKFLPKRLRIYLTKFLSEYLLKKYANIKVDGKENIPKDEPVIFICNHLSNLDGLLLSNLFEKIQKKVFFLAGVKLQGENLTNLVLDIVPHIEIEANKPDRKALRNAVGVLKDGNSILIFPEGTRSRTGEMIKGRSGVVLIARLAKARIVPLGIMGTEKCLPINQDGKMSKESFHHSDVDVKIGKPFTLDELEGEEIIDEMMKKVAGLLNEEYKGYYR